MASLDNNLAIHMLDWIYSEDFDKVIPAPEATLKGVAVLESARKVTVHV